LPGRKAALRASGLGADGVRAGLDRLVAQGVLPGPWRNKAGLLASLGIDLTSVQRAIEESFGAEAVCAASLARAGALGCGRTGSSSPAH